MFTSFDKFLRSKAQSSQLAREINKHEFAIYSLEEDKIFTKTEKDKIGISSLDDLQLDRDNLNINHKVIQGSTTYEVYQNASYENESNAELMRVINRGISIIVIIDPATRVFY